MKVGLVILCIAFSACCFSQTTGTGLDQSNLLVPILVKHDKVLVGNPFAQYLELKKMESVYVKSPLSEIYREQLKNFEQFLGLPLAGPEAMQLPALRASYSNKVILPIEYDEICPAIDVIKDKGKTHRIIIWAEEHHLPQTRALYRQMIEELWKIGFRYLAAEAFSTMVDTVRAKSVNYTTGFYTRDIVYADAVNRALQLGFKLVSYDNNAQERDKVQALTINQKVFEKDPDARILVLAGRGHAIEEKTKDGWEPMGYWLKVITGQDPFTLYAPTMSERLTPEEEHPAYNHIIIHFSPRNISILKMKNTNKLFGNNPYFDAYVFFPRVKLLYGRPDWLFTTLNRKPVDIPRILMNKGNQVVIQVIKMEQQFTDIPVDQVLVDRQQKSIKLALPKGEYLCRALYDDGSVSREVHLHVK